MNISRNALLEEQTHRAGIQFEDHIHAGANYEIAVEHDGVIYVSGQIPRVCGKIVVTGRLGQDIPVESGRQAARICALRALAILRQSLGDLNRVKKILKLNVYVQSAQDFTQQSEVADAASEILYSIFSPAGGHTRTSVGVYQLPKNAAVELDMIVAFD